SPFKICVYLFNSIPKNMSTLLGYMQSKISDLKRDVSLIYESTKEFLKERTDGLKAFKNVFKGFVDKVKDKTAQFQEKHDLEPKKNEFELTHNREVKKERSRDQGMSL
ncbi:hypothetical protein ACQUFA_14970, partial [Enterococcus faecalis]